jgi:quinol monooxygenase YgiN
MADDVVIVAGTFTVDPDQRTEFLEGRQESIKASREDRGCLQYAMSADAVDPAVVRLFEVWSSEADLEAHLQRMREPGQPPQGGVPVLAVAISKYIHAEERGFGS